MGARELLGELADIGVSVSAVGGNLLIQPEGVITDAHRAELRARKPELLALLLHAVSPALDRPYKLSPVNLAAAHADAWSEADMARFLARVAVIQRHGFDEQDSEDLAERLHLRDVHADHRHLCLECQHLSCAGGRWRCGNDEAAKVGRELPSELVTMSQDCPGFRETS